MDDALLSEVRRLWCEATSGVLSTLSAELPGYPFGSVVPYVTTAGGEPVIYISSIAQHTKNLTADPRACLTVVEPGASNPQASARISLVADAAEAAGAERAAAAEQYFAAFPASRAYEQTHGFAFWLLKPRRVRFIGGFGKIHWIEPDAWREAIAG